VISEKMGDALPGHSSLALPKCRKIERAFSEQVRYM